MKKILMHIRDLRNTKGLTQVYMAAKMGLSQNAYSKIELGYTELTVTRLLEIAALLDTTANFILNCV